MWVFADFVKKTMIGGGGGMIPLLRLAPIQVETGVLEHYMFALEYYVPVIRARIQHFAITIREHCHDVQPIKIPIPSL